MKPNPVRTSLAVPPKSILSFVDFSRSSMQGAKLATELARRWGSALELVHVLESVPPALSENADSAPDSTRRKRYYRSVEARLRATADDCRRLSRAAVLEGEPKELLRGLAAARGEDLIVMGAGRSLGFGGRLFGSVLQAVVEAARVPVLTVRGAIPRHWWPGRILTLMGPEPCHDAALLYAVGLAHKLDAAVSIAHIADGRDGRPAFAEKLEARLRRLGLGNERRVTEILSCTEPGDACFLERTRSGDVGLVALTAHRERPWDAPNLGTAARAALEGCAVPVLTVPAGEAPALDSLLDELSVSHRTRGLGHASPRS